ncbi:MAG: hypothetical protein R2792_01300 [Saprospiraceae bacterium]
MQLAEQENPVVVSELKTGFVFDSVSFRYANAERDALSEVQFALASGEK